MNLIMGISTELQQVERCGTCRYYLSYQDLRDDECINPESPRYDMGISEVDIRCEFYDERK